MNFNLDMAEAIRNVKRPTFKMPARPKQKKQPTKKATSLLRVQMNWIHLFAKKNLRNSIKNKLNMKKKKKGCFPLYWGNVHHPYIPNLREKKVSRQYAKKMMW